MAQETSIDIENDIENENSTNLKDGQSKERSTAMVCHEEVERGAKRSMRHSKYKVG